MEAQIAQTIRAQRKARNLTQEQLAEAMGVTVGAVSKWELGASAPDLGTVMELADFFETSVDVLLGYEWRQHGMEQAAEEIRELYRAKRFPEAIRAAEKALQKYPNSFDVVYESGRMYSLMMDREHAPRARELLTRACELIGQNTREDVNLYTLRNQIALCCAHMDRDGEAVALLKQNNAEGRNNAMIGFLLSQQKEQAGEALKYLSEAMAECQTELYRVTLGFANAYLALGQPDDAYEIMDWMHRLGQGLREPGHVTYMDKIDVGILGVLAETSAMRGQEEAACRWLKQAKEQAERFDAAPEYGMRGVKFYHASQSATVYDDFGETAMDGLLRILEEDENGRMLRPLWEQLTREEGQAQPMVEAPEGRVPTDGCLQSTPGYGITKL